MSVKVYVATRFGNWEQAKGVGELLWQAGHEPTATWVSVAEELGGVCAMVPIGDPRRHENAMLDYNDVVGSDAVIVLVPKEGGTGMWVELGVALALNKRALCIGPALERSIFCELCELYETVEQALEALP